MTAFTQTATHRTDCAAKITGARIGAAHDGVAELVVTIGFAGAGSTQITLDEHAGAALMAACGAKALDDLNGQSWQRVRDALAIAYNRFR